MLSKPGRAAGGGRRAAGGGRSDSDIITRHTRLILDAARIAADDHTSPGQLAKKHRARLAVWLLSDDEAMTQHHLAMRRSRTKPNSSKRLSGPVCR